MNPQIDFYVLSSDSISDQDNFICRLVQKAYRSQHQVYIHTNSPQVTKRLDQLLWTFNDISFVPHAYADSEAEAPVLIGENPVSDGARDILINLGDEVPIFYNQYQRVIEVVSGDPKHKQHARARYKHYAKENCQLTTHNIEE